jgi:hypothetical protein
MGIATMESIVLKADRMVKVNSKKEGEKESLRDRRLQQRAE